MRRAIGRTFRGVAAAAAIAMALAADAKPFDQLAPEQSTLFVGMRNVPDFSKRCQASPLGEIWNSPEMEPFVKKLTEAVETALAEMNKELGFKSADYKDLLQGEVALVMGDPAKMDFKAERLELPLALLVDIGKEKERAEEFLKKGFERIEKEDKMRRREEEFRGQKVTLIEPKEPKKGEPKSVAITLADDLLAVSLSEPFLQDILANRGESAVKPLSEHPDYRALRETYGKEADVFVYANAGRWLEEMPRLMKATGGERAEQQVEMTTKMLDIFGIAAIRAVSGSVTLGADGFRQTLFVLAPGTPKGFVKMFWTQPQALRFPALVPEDVNSCTLMQVDIDAVWKTIEEMARTFAAAMAGPAGPNGPPDPLAMIDQQLGISLKKDLIDLIGKQMIVYDRLKKPYSARSQTLAFLFDIKDKEKFQGTLDKILALAPIFQKKEYLGRSIYTMGRGLEMEEEGGQEEAKRSSVPRPALCLTDTHLAFTTSKDMAEEAIRRVGKEVKSVNDAPSFKAVAGRLPASAILISYQSPEIFEYWFALAKDFAKGGRADADEDAPAAPDGDSGDSGRRKGMDIERLIRGACAKLPDAAVVTKRIAGTVGWGFTEERGLGFSSEFLFRK